MSQKFPEQLQAALPNLALKIIAGEEHKYHISLPRFGVAVQVREGSVAEALGLLAEAVDVRAEHLQLAAADIRGAALLWEPPFPVTAVPDEEC